MNSQQFSQTTQKIIVSKIKETDIRNVWTLFIHIPNPLLLNSKHEQEKDKEKQNQNISNTNYRKTIC